jgi:hypothetical protein
MRVALLSKIIKVFQFQGRQQHIPCQFFCPNSKVIVRNCMLMGTAQKRRSLLENKKQKVSSITIQNHNSVSVSGKATAYSLSVLLSKLKSHSQELHAHGYCTKKEIFAGE